MYKLKCIALELLFWLLAPVEEILWMVIILIYFGLLVLFITLFPIPYSYYLGSIGVIIGLVLSFKLPDITSWTQRKKQKLKKERDRLRQITNT